MRRPIPNVVPGGTFRGSERYELRHPITWHGRQITAVTLRWPSLDRLQRVQRLGASAEHALEFVALMTGLPRPAVEEMDLEDIDRLKDTIGNFVGFTPGGNHGRP